MADLATGQETATLWLAVHRMPLCEHRHHCEKLICDCVYPDDPECGCPWPNAREETWTRKVRRSLDALAGRGLVEKVLIPNKGWNYGSAKAARWRLTEDGADYCRQQLDIAEIGGQYVTDEERFERFAEVMANTSEDGQARIRAFIDGPK